MEDGLKRILVNAVLTGAITTATIMMTLPATNWEKSFIVSACLSGILKCLIEMKEAFGNSDRINLLAASLF